MYTEVSVQELCNIHTLSMAYNSNIINFEQWVYECKSGYNRVSGLKLKAFECMFIQPTGSEHFKLFVVKLHLFLWNEAALRTLPHRIHKTHPGQRHFLTAAFIAETPTAAPAVMLTYKEETLIASNPMQLHQTHNSNKIVKQIYIHNILYIYQYHC